MDFSLPSWGAIRWKIQQVVEQERTHLTAGAVLVVALVLLHLAGVFAPLQQVSDELMYRIRGERATQNDVLMVLVDRDVIDQIGHLPYASSRLDDALEEIRRQQPTTVAVDFGSGLFARPYTPLDERCAETAGEDQTIFYGLGGRSGDFPEACRWKSVEPVAGTTLPTETTGRQAGAETLVGTLARRAGTPDIPATVDTNFVGPRGLPTVSMASLLRGTLPSDLFRGRTVLVTDAIPGRQATLPTPFGPTLAEEIRAQAVATLIDRATLAGGHWWPAALIPLFVLLGGWLTRYRWAVPGLVGTTALWWTAGYLAFRAGYQLQSVTWPVGAWSAFLVMHGFSTVRDEVREQVHDRLSRAVERSGAERAMEEGSEGGFWQQLVDRPLKLLPDVKMALAELPTDSRWIEFRAFHDLEADQIWERRRDVRRAPYVEPREERRATVTDGYLEDDAYETLFVPLFAQDRLRGFWMLHDPDAEGLYARHRELIDRVGEQMSQEIYWRQLERSAPEQADRPTEDAGEVMETALAAMDKLELDRRSLEDVVANADVGLMMTNLFGEVIHENEVMARLLVDEEGRRMEYDSLAELIALLEDESVAEASQRLRNLLIDEEAMQMAVELPGDPTRHAEFRVSLIENDDETRSTAGGLLVTGIDVTRTIEQQNQKLDLVGVIHTRAADLMSFATGYTDVLALSDGLGDAERELVEGLQESLSSLDELVDDFADILNPPDDEVAAETPVALQNLARDAVRDVGDRTNLGQATFEFPEEPVIARSHPPSLEKALRLVLLDIDDFAGGAAEVTLTGSTGPEEVQLTIQAPEMGLPNALIQRLIGDADEDVSDEESRLVVAKSYVESAGGAFEAFSSVDGGTVFMLRLPQLESAAGVEPPAPFEL